MSTRDMIRTVRDQLTSIFPGARYEMSQRRKHKLLLYAAQKDQTITRLIEDWVDSLILEKERDTPG